jgi:hypothetical protein
MTESKEHNDIYVEISSTYSSEKNCKTKNYDIISGSKTTHKMRHSTWVSKLVFSSEPQDRKSSDPQALGPAQFSADTMKNVALYLLKNMYIFSVI